MKVLNAIVLGCMLTSNAVASPDVIGNDVYAPSGKLLGKEIIHTDLKGTWFGLATALETVDGLVKKTNSVHLVCFLESNGTTLCDGQFSGPDGMLKNEPPWTGRLYYLTPQVYLNVNGDPDREDSACDLYEVQVNRSGDMLNAAMLSTGECVGITKVFWEMNNFVKVSDSIDYNRAVDVVNVTNQWVVD